MLLNQVVNTLVTTDISNTAVVAPGKSTDGQKYLTVHWSSYK